MSGDVWGLSGLELEEEAGELVIIVTLTLIMPGVALFHLDCC